MLTSAKTKQLIKMKPHPHSTVHTKAMLQQIAFHPAKLHCKQEEVGTVLWWLKVNQIAFLTFHSVGLDFFVCIATGYGLHCQRIKSRWGATLSYTVKTGPVAYRFPLQGKESKAWRRQPTPSSTRLEK